MYDSKHRILAISSNPDVPERFRQTGVYEKLLCADCDNRIIGSYESYARGVLYGGERIMTAMDGNDMHLSGLDYRRLRLFFLSLLWRMSIAEDAFFAEVSLGPHEEVLRNMLLSGEPGNPDQYGFLCVAPVFDHQHLGDWMMPPDWVRAYGRRIYRCLVGGLLYCFFVGKAKLPAQIDRLLLEADGSWVIPRQSIETIKFLRDLCMQMGTSMQQREMKNRLLISGKT